MASPGSQKIAPVFRYACVAALWNDSGLSIRCGDSLSCHRTARNALGMREDLTDDIPLLNILNQL